MCFIAQRNLIRGVIPILLHDNGAEGLAKIRQHLHLFENITFVDGNSDYGHFVALHITNSHIHKVVDNPPMWFKEQFEAVFENLNNSDL